MQMDNKYKFLPAINPIIIPPMPTPIIYKDDRGVVKNPTRDVLNISSLLPEQSPSKIQSLLFEQFSAIELSNVLRHDTVQGIDQKYLIVSNLFEITKKYEASKALSVRDKNNPLTAIYSINLSSKIPNLDYIKRNNLDRTYQYLDENNILKTVQKSYVYIESNGDLVIELDNLEDSEFIQIQIDTNGTIYKVES
jgi:hypothetical protein